MKNLIEGLLIVIISLGVGYWMIRLIAWFVGSSFAVVSQAM